MKKTSLLSRKYSRAKQEWDQVHCTSSFSYFKPWNWLLRTLERGRVSGVESDRQAVSHRRILERAWPVFLPACQSPLFSESARGDWRDNSCSLGSLLHLSSSFFFPTVLIIKWQFSVFHHSFSETRISFKSSLKWSAVVLVSFTWFQPLNLSELRGRGAVTTVATESLK